MITKKGRGVGESVETGEITDNAVTAAKIAAGVITNSHISATAAIALSKLADAGAASGNVIKFDGTDWAIGTISDAWNLVGAANLSGGAADTLEVSGISPTYEVYKVIGYLAPSGNITPNLRFNADTGANYATDIFQSALQYTGAADTTITLMVSTTGAHYYLWDITIFKLATEPAILSLRGHRHNEVFRGGGRWNNTVDAISRISFINTGAGDFGTSSQMVVLGRNI